MTMLHIF